ncbi:hypothetical protein Bbelb_179430, partial [Branchiostoma belcheri]
ALHVPNFLRNIFFNLFVPIHVSKADIFRSLEQTAGRSLTLVSLALLAIDGENTSHNSAHPAWGLARVVVSSPLLPCTCVKAGGLPVTYLYASVIRAVTELTPSDRQPVSDKDVTSRPELGPPMQTLYRGCREPGRDRADPVRSDRQEAVSDKDVMSRPELGPPMQTLCYESVHVVSRAVTELTPSDRQQAVSDKDAMSTGQNWVMLLQHL